jgi:hypothetical protein
MIDKRNFIKDLKDIRDRCLRNSNYNPEDDMAYLIAKYNLDWDFIWRRIRKILTM